MVPCRFSSRVGVRGAGALLLVACADVATPSYAPAPLPGALHDGASGGERGASDGGASPDGGGVGAAAWAPTVIYLVMPDRFANGDPNDDRLGPPGCFDPKNPRGSHGGDLAGVTAHLPYLRELGVDALWLTPVARQTACGYHGYWADYADPDDGAVDPALGSLDAMRSLVAGAHAAGIGVVLDMVVNHAGRGARIVGAHPDWFHAEATCNARGVPDEDCPIAGGLPDFAQEKPEVAAYLTAMSTGWLARTGVDGIRMDTAKNVPLAYFRDAWLPAVREAHPGLYTLAEVYETGSAARMAPYLDAGFDAAFAYPLYAALVRTFAEAGPASAVADAMKDAVASLGIARARRLVTFIDNHDNRRFPTAIPFGVDGAEAVLRDRLALAALFTLPGVPQIYAGDELALYGGNDPDNRRDIPAWAWTAAGRTGTHSEGAGDAQSTFAWVKRLVALRRGTRALTQGDYVERARGDAGGNVLAFTRDAGGERLIVALNAGPASTASFASGLPDGTSLERLLGDGPPALTVAAGKVTIALPAWGAAVYRAGP